MRSILSKSHHTGGGRKTGGGYSFPGEILSMRNPPWYARSLMTVRVNFVNYLTLRLHHTARRLELLFDLGWFSYLGCLH